MSRDNFSNQTKLKLAQRAGQRCSICDKLTVGPSNESINSVNSIGVAAHISGASSGRGSRRYLPDMTSKERSSIENGIWLCSTHADLIDGDEITYPISKLKLIKENHERKIKIELSGINVNKGIITKIEISNFGVVSEKIDLEFSNKNIIYGNSGVGKTMIFELLSSISNKKHLKRWLKNRKGVGNSYCNIYYLENMLNKYSIIIDKNNKVTYCINDSPVPFLNPPFSVLFINQSFGRFLNSIPEKKKLNSSIVTLLAMYFNLNKDEFINVIAAIARDKKFFFNDINLDDEQGDLKIKIQSDSPNLSFNSLSGGEQLRVILEITLKIASYHSRFKNIILLIESTSFGSIDISGINKLFEIIRSEDWDFQFFFSSLFNEGHITNNFHVNKLYYDLEKRILKNISI